MSERLALGDEKLIDDLVKEQTDTLSLSFESQRQLARALHLVADTSTQQKLNRLGQMVPQLFTGEGGNLLEAFTNSLQRLGYEVKAETLIPEVRDPFAPRHYAMRIREPKASLLGGTMIAVDWSFPGGLSAESEVNADKLLLR